MGLVSGVKSYGAVPAFKRKVSLADALADADTAYEKAKKPKTVDANCSDGKVENRNGDTGNSSKKNKSTSSHLHPMEDGKGKQVPDKTFRPSKGSESEKEKEKLKKRSGSRFKSTDESSTTTDAPAPAGIRSTSPTPSHLKTMITYPSKKEKRMKDKEKKKNKRSKEKGDRSPSPSDRSSEKSRQKHSSSRSWKQVSILHTDSLPTHCCDFYVLFCLFIDLLVVGHR